MIRYKILYLFSLMYIMMLQFNVPLFIIPASWWNGEVLLASAVTVAGRQRGRLTNWSFSSHILCDHAIIRTKSKIFIIARWLWFQHSTKVKAFVMCEIIWMMSCWLLCFHASCFISDDVLLGYTRHWLYFTQVGLLTWRMMLFIGKMCNWLIPGTDSK